MPQYSIFTTQTPSITNSNDGVSYALGTTFYSRVAGNVTGIRWFFPTTLPTGTVTAALYVLTGDSTGTSMGTATFSSPVAGQWNTATFSSPIAINAFTLYKAVIWTANRYVGTTGVFTSASVINGPLVASQSGTDPTEVNTYNVYNGTYLNGPASITFPTLVSGQTNYFVDVVLEVPPPAAAPYRLYLTNAAPGYTPATKRGSWDDSGATLARKLGRRPEGAAATAARAETNITNLYDVLLGRWVSEPARVAGELSGAMNWAVGAMESAAAANLFFHWHVYVTAGDTDTVRGVLRTSAVNANEWPIAPATGRTGNDWTLDPVNVQVGDRLVVELGYQAQNTVTTSRTGTINYGNTGETDLTLNSANVTTEPGWVEFTDAAGIFWDTVGNVVDDFADGTVDTTNRWSATWVDGGTTPIETGGRLRLYCNTGYAGVLTAPWLYFRDTEASWEMVTLANGATATSECYFKGSVDSTVAGTYLGWYLNLKTGVLRAHSAVDYWDDDGVEITWNATTHRWLRIREASGSVYWETSTDGTTWTVRRTAETPYWCNYKDLALSFDAHRDAGTGDYFEIDNVNTGPPTDVVYEKSVGPDTADIVDAATAVETKVRTVADTAAISDAATAVETKVRTVADTAAISDAATAAQTHPRGAADTIGVADAAAAVLARARGVADTAEITDAAVTVEVEVRAVADTVEVDDAVFAVLARVRGVADTVEIADAAAVVEVKVRAVADTVEVDDAAAALMAAPRTVEDTAGIADAVVAVLARVRAVADTVPVDDVAARTRAVTVAVSDQVPVAETLGTNAGDTVTVGDTVEVADSVTVVRSYVRAAGDTVPVADAAATAEARLRTASDTVAVDDSAARASARARVVADAVDVADTAGVLSGSAFAPADSVPVVDTLFASLARGRGVGDTVDLVDAVTVVEAKPRAVADTVPIADEVTAVLGFVYRPADTVPVADEVTALLTRAWARGAADTVDVADAAVVVEAKVRTAGDVVALVDQVDVEVARVRSFGVADTAAIADLVVAVAGKQVLAGDGVPLVDALVARMAWGRSVTDAVAVGDSAIAQLVRGAVAPSRTEVIPVVQHDATVPVIVAETTAPVGAGGTVVPVPSRQITIRIT